MEVSIEWRKILINQHCWGSVVNITAAIGRRSRTFASLLTLGLTVIAIITRLVVPARFSTAFILLLPISFASWFLSWHVAALVAVVGAALLFRFDLRYANVDGAVASWNEFVNLLPR